MKEFTELKRDVRDGYSYREYEVRYGKGEITLILDQPNECVIIDGSRWGDPDGTNDYRVAKLPLDEVMEMNSKELEERINYLLFY